MEFLRTTTGSRSNAMTKGAPIVLATLCLNEMEWLPSLYEQHKHWPRVERWVFVEAADRVYAECNPDRVTPNGLSVDGTSEFLWNLCSKDSRVVYIPHGFTGGGDRAQGKCEARQRYLDYCHGMAIKPDFIVVIDADEFYPTVTQQAVNRLMIYAPNPGGLGLVLKQRQIWYPPSVAAIHNSALSDDCPILHIFDREVIGGYWDIPHCRIWRYHKGMRYRDNHNTPELINGRSFKEGLVRYDKIPPTIPFTDGYPECIHLGYTSSLSSRSAKHRYYVARGEGKEQGRLGKVRRMYVDCREAYETWKEGDELPHGAKVIPYTGPIPECFQPDSTPFQQYIPPGHYVVEDVDGERFVRKDDPNRRE